ncbi:hypothetical protein I210019B1_02590 [Faecalibacterium sp. i21-0019-B1]
MLSYSVFSSAGVLTVIVSSFLLADFLSDISVNTGGLFCKRELQNLSGYTILEENWKKTTKTEGKPWHIPTIGKTL